MDGVLGGVDTDYMPGKQNSPGTASKGVKARNLHLGQSIRFEFGVSGNLVRMNIEMIYLFSKQVVVFGKNTGLQDDYSFGPDEMVEVVENE